MYQSGLLAYFASFSPEGFVLWLVPLQKPSFHSASTPPPQQVASVSSLCALQAPRLADSPDAAGWAPSQLKMDKLAFYELHNTVLENYWLEKPSFNKNNSKGKSFEPNTPATQSCMLSASRTLHSSVHLVKAVGMLERVPADIQRISFSIKYSCSRRLFLPWSH